MDVEYLVIQLILAAWINELVLLAARPLPNNSLLRRSMCHHRSLYALLAASKVQRSSTSHLK